MPTVFTPQDRKQDDSQPAVWPLVEEDLRDRWMYRGPSVGSKTKRELYDQVLDMLVQMRLLIGPDRSTATLEEIVATDMQERDKMGIERYGSPLRPFCDEKPPLLDAYEELLDFVVYMKQSMLEEGS